MKLIEEYMNLLDNYVEEHGSKTVLLMQVGAFYEIYAYNDSNDFSYNIIHQIGDITGLLVVEKSICVGGRPILAAGFRDYSLEKWVDKMQQYGFTCVVYSQDANVKNTTRSLTCIYTPGTFVSTDNNNENHNNTCLWIEKMKDNLHVGITNIDIVTGKGTLYEYSTKFTGIPNMYDDIERYISTYSPREIIIISNLSTSEIESIIQYVRITSINIILINLNDQSHNNVQRAHRCEMQKYQREMFETFFTVKNMDMFFHQYTYSEFALKAYCYLLSHLNVLNPLLIEKIMIPIVENLTDRLLLANHSSKQLNIVGGDGTKYSSVLTLTDHTMTIMGKRKHKHLILHPITSRDELETMYNVTECILNSNDLLPTIREYLNPIRDLDKYTRLIILKQLPVKAIHCLYENIKRVGELSFYLNNKEECDNLHINPGISEVQSHSREIIDYIESHIDIDKSKTMQTIEDNFFNRGIYSDLDKVCEEYVDKLDQLQCIIVEFDKLMNTAIQPKKYTSYIKLHDTEKSGYSIQITKSRVAPFQDILKGYHGSEFKWKYTSSYSEIEKPFTLNVSDINIQKINTTIHITSPHIHSLCQRHLQLKQVIKDIVTEKYELFLNAFCQHTQKLYSTSDFISYIDVIQNRAFVAKKYNYCRPNIMEEEVSYVKTTSLRHPLIEHINQNELYVANDICIGHTENTNNVLLFGTNAVGKTSFIKSLGIAIILAQCGMFVPASSFVYVPYRELYTRILNCDNLFKGLSTFTLEMSEMSNILHYAGRNSLVLGDELCSGTELPSATSIFLAGLQYLSAAKSSFIFATHFHELLNMEEIHTISSLTFKHMRVKYDVENKCIIYDRKLQEGSGEQIYGLEVCKSLYLPESFMTDAYEILNKYYSKDTLSFESSHYNRKKLKTFCEICKKEPGDHVHHLLYQKDANGDFISHEVNNSIHKNHCANLISICEQCHNDIHEKDIRYVKKQTTNGTILEASIV